MSVYPIFGQKQVDIRSESVIINDERVLTVGDQTTTLVNTTVTGLGPVVIAAYRFTNMLGMVTLSFNSWSVDPTVGGPAVYAIALPVGSRPANTIQSFAIPGQDNGTPVFLQLTVDTLGVIRVAPLSGGFTVPGPLLAGINPCSISFSTSLV
jgi:hypothetical protein